MRATGLIAVLALLGSTHAVGADRVPSHVDTAWVVTSDAEGHVVKLMQHTRYKAEVAKPLAKLIRSWTFEPGSINGQPQVTQTTLNVRLSVEPRGERYLTRVADVHTGPRVVRTAELRFPNSQLKPRDGHNYSALTVLKVKYNQNGKVTAVSAAPGTPPGNDEVFMRVSMASVKRWSFEPERVGGHGVAGAVYLPIGYALWHPSRSSAGAECGSWQVPGRERAVRGGEVLSENPVARLKSEVVGSTP